MEKIKDPKGRKSVYCIQETKSMSGLGGGGEGEVRNEAGKMSRSQNKKGLVRHAKKFRFHRELKRARQSDVRQQMVMLAVQGRVG